jgi:hypothetical protein
MNFPMIKNIPIIWTRKALSFVLKLKETSRVQILKIGNASLGVLGILCNPTHFILMKGTHQKNVF